MLPTRWIVIGLVAAGLVWYVWDCEATKKDHARFVAHVEALAQAQERRVKEIEARNLKSKEAADAQAKLDKSRITALSRSLHNERARTRELSVASATASGSTRVPLNWPDLLREVGRLDAGLSELAGDADKERVSLDSAKVWARSLAE